MSPEFMLLMGKFKEGLAGEGWTIKLEVFAGICTEFSEALC